MNARFFLDTSIFVYSFDRSSAAKGPALDAAHSTSGGHAQGHRKLSGSAGVLQGRPTAICAAHDRCRSGTISGYGVPATAGCAVFPSPVFRSPSSEGPAPSVLV